MFSFLCCVDETVCLFEPNIATTLQYRLLFAVKDFHKAPVDISAQCALLSI